jgi:hypothetical protein
LPSTWPCSLPRTPMGGLLGLSPLLQCFPNPTVSAHAAPPNPCPPTTIHQPHFPPTSPPTCSWVASLSQRGAYLWLPGSAEYVGAFAHVLMSPSSGCTSYLWASGSIWEGRGERQGFGRGEVAAR